MSTTKFNHMGYARDMIRIAIDCDRRGDAAGRDRAISQLRADSNLPRKTISTLLRNAGLAK
jgi:hypothetical protein